MSQGSGCDLSIFHVNKLVCAYSRMEDKNLSLNAVFVLVTFETGRICMALHEYRIQGS